MAEQKSAYELALQMILASFQEPNPQLEELQQHARALADTVRVLNPDSPEIDFELLMRELESRFNVFQPSSGMLVDESDHVEWLRERSEEIEWNFWNRYLRYQREHISLPPVVLHRLDESTRNVLAQIEDPKRKGPWSRRGLVAGQVQSGKTSNYVGLMCKAVDAGYRVIVVLAGLDNNLRSQTQLRVDEGLLGFDTQRRLLAGDVTGFSQDALGAGLLPGQRGLDIASLTTSLDKGDFTRNAVNVGIRPSDLLPIVAVIKKNVSVMRNLREWLTSVCTRNADGLIENEAILVIDDEADNASINTKKPDENPAAVNREIRLLLGSFSKSAYVGYTATPFANIYIDQDVDHDELGRDLYPRSFIETLRPPSNYFGPSRLFGIDVETDEMPLHRRVDDYETWIPDKHRKDLQVGQLPLSLKRAMKAFVLARACRLHRGQTKKHNSMLVHVTRFNDVQRRVREQVEQELESLKARLKFGDGDEPNVMAEFRAIWEEDFVPTIEGLANESAPVIPWEEIQELLVPSVEPIVVRSINGDAKDVLDYFDNRNTGFNVIAIGGNKLSRGLTLEGLSVSYYLRTTRMYDTLLQMGRWFGYRPGYEDLCRLYTTEKLWKAYRAVTLASNEAYREFETMCELGLTPEDYGLKVRNSVEGMIVTSPNKLRNGVRLKIGFAGDLSQSTSIFADRRRAEKNIEAFNHLLSTLRDNELVGKAFRPVPSGQSHMVWNGVHGETIAEFFDRVLTPESAYRVNSRLLARFIRGQVRRDKLVDWTVAVASPRQSQSNEMPVPFKASDISISLTRRSMPVIRGSREPVHDAWERLVGEGLYTVKTVVSPGDEMIDLSAAEQEGLLSAEIAKWKLDGSKGSEPAHPTGRRIRDSRDGRKGLLLIYLLESPLHLYRDKLVKESSSDELSEGPLLGFAVSFPKIDDAPKEEYVVTQLFMKELRELSDDWDDDDDD